MMCAMKFQKQLTYDASPEAVAAMLADPAFREKVAQAQDVVSASVTVTPKGAGFTLVNDQVQRTAGLPAIARKITGETTPALITEEWSDSANAAISILAPGRPTSMIGTITLAASGAGTVETVDLDIKVKVPLINGKLEQIMADQIEAGYDVERVVGVAWLTEAK